MFLFINGSLGIILIGIALGTFFTGGNFIRNDMNLSHWVMSSYGLEAVFHPFNVVFGITLFCLARVQAGLYFINNIQMKSVTDRAKKQLRNDTIFFLGFFLLCSALLLTMSGYTIGEELVYVEPFKFLKNFLANPLLLVLFVCGVFLILFALYITLFKGSKKGIFFSGAGTVMAALSLLCLLGFNDTAIYPSLADTQSTLSIANASASHYTLSVMSYVSLGVPFVLGYIYLVWRSMDATKISSEEIEADDHHY